MQVLKNKRFQMRKKKITFNIDCTYKYVQLWNVIFNLTEKELQILASFIDVNDITDEVNICCIRNKREVARVVGAKDYNTLNNYIKKFKDKGTILKKDGDYKLNPFLNPETDSVEILIKR